MGQEAEAGTERRRLWKRRWLAAAVLISVCAGSIGAALELAGRTAQPGRPGATVPARSSGRVKRPVRLPRSRAEAAGVPILMYHVLARPFPNSPFPGLYVPPAEFRAQMHALAAVGFHAVTLSNVRKAWAGEATLPRKPIVLTFDNGYRTQYTVALPVLRRLGWVADENIQLSGLPPKQGGLTAREVRGLIAAGWELDTQGFSHANLTSLDAAQLRFQVAIARARLRHEFGVPVVWFCYPSGLYDSAVVAEVRAAGFIGSTTVAPGWARARDNPFELPRLRVLGGTSPAELLQLIAASAHDPAPPRAYP